MIDLHARDTEAARVLMKALWKRRLQLLTTDDADILIALRELRQMDDKATQSKVTTS